MSEQMSISAQTGYSKRLEQAGSTIVYPTDTIIVLRNHSFDRNEWRVTRGVALSTLIGAPLYQPYESNTSVEAIRVVEMARALKWDRVVILTEEFHMPRALLTFIKYAEEYPKVFPYWVANMPGTNSLDEETVERYKIQLYYNQNHLVSYQEGAEYLASRNPSDLHPTSE